MSGTGLTAGLPGRRVVVASLVGALAAGGLFGMVTGVLNPSAAPKGRLASNVTLQPAGAGSTAAAPTGQGGAVAAGGSAAPAATRKVTVSTTTLPAGGAVTQDYVKHPERDGTLTLTVIQSVDAHDPQHVTIYLRAAQLLQGGRALLYYATRGQQPRNTAIVPLDNAQPQGVTLQANAALWGVNALSGGQGRQRLQLDQFLGVLNQLLAQDQHPGVWVRRGNDGGVSYLAEAKTD